MQSSQGQRLSIPPAAPTGAVRWLRVRQAAAHLCIGVGTLDKLRIYGGGPRYAKLGHTIVYAATDLDAWAEARKVSSTSERVRTA